MNARKQSRSEWKAGSWIQGQGREKTMTTNETGNRQQRRNDRQWEIEKKRIHDRMRMNRQADGQRDGQRPTHMCGDIQRQTPTLCAETGRETVRPNEHKLYWKRHREWSEGWDTRRSKTNTNRSSAEGKSGTDRQTHIDKHGDRERARSGRRYNRKSSCIMNEVNVTMLICFAGQRVSFGCLRFSTTRVIGIQGPRSHSTPRHTQTDRH